MTEKKQTIVIAFGGNALKRKGEKGFFEEQEKRVEETLVNLVPLFEKYNVIITHGNGPQVGNVLLQHEGGSKYGIPKFPLHACVSETQGSIAYMIEKQLINLLKEKKIEKDVCSLVTQVVVDPKDEAFQNPRKPVGPFYTKEEYEKIQKAQPDWKFKYIETKEGDNKNYRRVVASPIPVDIVNIRVIKKVIEMGAITITVGGGGIPVSWEEGKLVGKDAVIDKDRATCLLAKLIDADRFVICTDVPYACVNFNKSNESKLGKVKYDEMAKHVKDGQFAAGSMKPKIESCLQFLEGTKKEGAFAIVTTSENLSDFGNKGTVISK